MVAGSILPVAIHKNKLYFLFGKENELADTPGFSDFGGRVEEGETPFTAALREGAEELCGFLGDEKELGELIKKNGGTYDMVKDKYHIHIFFIDYDENLPTYYNQNRRFLWSKLSETDKQQLEKTKLFEKGEIDWFSVSDMKKRVGEFRQFYQKTVGLIVKDSAKIRGFCNNSHIGSHNVTKKYISKLHLKRGGQ
jgi:8-oxo-dGTP pyrophosphatase MutT (NUDIX family)